MNTINYVIVKTANEYNNTKKITEDITLIINSTIEAVDRINRVVEIVSAPKFTVLQEGDEIVIHHNILRNRNGQQGGQVGSDYYIKDDLYFIPLTEIFAYKRDGKWNALDPFVFVKPIKYKTYEKGSSLLVVSMKESSHKGYVKRRGVMCFPNKELQSYGVKEGDVITFSADSEYEFEIEGEIYYKMMTKDVLAVIVNEEVK